MARPRCNSFTPVYNLRLARVGRTGPRVWMTSTYQTLARRRPSSDNGRQRPSVCGVWGDFCIHGGRTGILRLQGLYQRAQALPVLQGQPTGPAEGIRTERRTRAISGRLCRVRQRGNGAVQAQGRPPGLLQRLLQQAALFLFPILACPMVRLTKSSPSPPPKSPHGRQQADAFILPYTDGRRRKMSAAPGVLMGNPCQTGVDPLRFTPLLT